MTGTQRARVVLAGASVGANGPQCGLVRFGRGQQPLDFILILVEGEMLSLGPGGLDFPKHPLHEATTVDMTGEAEALGHKWAWAY